MRRLLMIAVLAAGVGLAQSPPAGAVYEPLVQPPYMEDLRVPYGVSEDWVAAWGPTVTALHHLMSDGEKWAACDALLSSVVEERYGVEVVLAWQQFACVEIHAAGWRAAGAPTPPTPGRP